MLTPHHHTTSATSTTETGTSVLQHGSRVRNTIAPEKGCCAVQSASSLRTFRSNALPRGKGRILRQGEQSSLCPATAHTVMAYKAEAFWELTPCSVLMLGVACLSEPNSKLKNVVFLDVTQRGSCKNRSFAATYRIHHQRRSRKRRSLQEPHGVTSQKTAFFIVTAVKTPNLSKSKLVQPVMILTCIRKALEPKFD
jgi:hypothetical protein